MTKDELLRLHDLLRKWAYQPDWDKNSAAWANIVETCRQVEIDLRTLDPTWKPD